jgi:hypothetical protein
MSSGVLARLIVGAAVLVLIITAREPHSRGQEPKKAVAPPPAVDKAAAERAERDRAVEAANKKAAKEAAVDKLAENARAAVVVDDPVVAQWEQQFAPQFNQLYKGELHFMRLVTNLTKEQYEKIAADGQPTVKSAIRKYANAMQRGGEYPDPRVGISEAIAKSVEAHLSPEQAAKYRKEIEERSAARKKLIVRNLVSLIDRTLILQPDQRKKLGNVLANNWHESWNQTQILMYGGRYFPVMPDDKIDPILTDSQRAVWRGITRQQIRFGPNFGFGGGFEFEDEVWEDDPPKKPEKPGGAKAPDAK